MEIAVIHFIILGVISGLTKGAGVLPDGPLHRAVGEPVMFTTRLDPPETPFRSVNWIFGDKNIIVYSGENNIAPEYEGRITFFLSTGSLELRNLTLNDSGEYSVNIVPFGGVPEDGNTRLDVYEEVSNVMATASSTDLVESSSVHLSCSSSGSSLSFLWLNSSSEVTASDRVQLTDGGANLTIVNVTRYDQGPFRCHVSNPVSNGTSDPVNLTINYGPENINLTISPSQEYFVEGSDISLSCSADSSPSAQFMWLLNGDLQSDTGPELRLMNIQMSQSGNYSCQAFNNKTLRYITSQPAAISVLKRVANVVVTSNTTDLLEFNSSVSLSCSSSGLFLSFLWLNSSSEVTESDRVQLSDGNSTLTIVSVTRYDQGPFRCRVFNPVSNGTSDPVNLTINYGPENINLIISPSQEHYVEGSDISLSCSADSRPSAQFQWFLNGDLLFDTGPELRLMNIQMSHIGNYSCRAFNNKTMRYEKTQLSIVSVLERISGASITSSTNLTIEGNSVNLTCDAAGSVFTGKWMKGGSDLILAVNMALHDNNRVLSFSSLNKQDDGEYSCNVSNHLSNDEADFTMVVYYGPENVQIRGPNEIHLEETLTLTCSAESVPASYTWILNGKQIHYSAIYTKNNTEPSDSGNYICVVMNDLTWRISAAVHELTVTEEVSNVMVTANSTYLVESSSSVHLSCSSTGSSLSFLWLNGSSEVTASDRVQLTDGGANLTIVNVTRYDQGPFRCHVSNPVSNGTRGPINFNISYGPENINLIISPSQEHYVEGSDISLMCSAVSRPSAQFMWLLNGDLLSDTGPELRLMNIQMSQSGNYSCRAFNNKTMRYITSQPAAISVLKRVANVVVTSDTTDLLEFNSSVSLSCSSSGTFLSFLWLNSSSEVTVSDRVQFSDGGSTLTIVSVTRCDQGPFMCHVFNPVSNGTSDPVNLTINYGPENINLTISPSQEHYVEGSDISLSCSADSRPSAQFQWFLNGDLLSDTEPELRLMNLQMSHSGNYSCRAFNNKTMRYITSQPAAISVLKRVANVVVTSNTTDLLEFNSSVSLSCSSSGLFLSFLWLNSSSEVTESDRVQLSDGGSTLTIVSVTRYDQGPFRCHVSNHFSNVTSDPIDLLINYGPENTNLIISPSQEHYVEGSNISLMCSAVSRPSAQFQWFLNGDLLSDTGPELRLMNIQTSQSGNYSCQAFNNKTMRYEKSQPSVVSVVLGELEL
ncbi:hemicentin-1-like [Sebastes fasciatus]|uniref:hemicentin-1-like n=1 Tax=Sebastes fasciatus TaxID=394691 RepID=UPI003D9F3A1A